MFGRSDKSLAGRVGVGDVVPRDCSVEPGSGAASLTDVDIDELPVIVVVPCGWLIELGSGSELLDAVVLAIVFVSCGCSVELASVTGLSVDVVVDIVSAIVVATCG